MSYEPTNWKSGDVVTSQKLNKMETGIAAAALGGGVMLVHTAAGENGTSFVMDKTWGEIYAAAEAGPVFIKSEGDDVVSWIIPLIHDYGADAESERYTVGVLGVGNTETEFVAATPDDYPTYDPGR